MLKKKQEEKKVGGDVGLPEDLAFALKNLIAAEDHAYNSYVMNQDDPQTAQKWLQVVDAIRKIRSRWLKVFTKEENSEIWCFNKHALAASMGLSEVANRLNNMGKSEECEVGYKDAGDLMGAIYLLNGHKEVKNV